MSIILKKEFYETTVLSNPVYHKLIHADSIRFLWHNKRNLNTLIERNTNIHNMITMLFINPLEPRPWNTTLNTLWTL